MNLRNYLRLQWDRVGAVLAAVVGVVLLAVGYRKVADTQYIAEQLPYILSAGFGAILALTVAAALWISADLRDEWRELADQGDHLRRLRVEAGGDLRAMVSAEVGLQLGAREGTEPTAGT